MLRKLGTLIFLALILCGGCAGSVQTNSKEEAFATLVNLGEDYNQSLELVTINNHSNVNLNTFSALSIKINSRNPIWFTSSYGRRYFLFSEEKNEWIEVYGDVNFPSSNPIVKEHNDDFAFDAIFYFLPRNTTGYQRIRASYLYRRQDHAKWRTNGGNRQRIYRYANCQVSLRLTTCKHFKSRVLILPEKIIASEHNP